MKLIYSKAGEAAFEGYKAYKENEELWIIKMCTFQYDKKQIILMSW